jgi:hypothetical protein
VAKRSEVGGNQAARIIYRLNTIHASHIIKLKRWVDGHSARTFLVGTAIVLAESWNRFRRSPSVILRNESKGISSAVRPQVSVLVAAWNEADRIRDHITSFHELKYPNKELILCVGGNDGSYNIARQMEIAGVQVLKQEPGEGKQCALRRCLRYANGEIVFLTDADCLLDDHSFERTLSPIIDDGEYATSGWVRPFNEQLDNPFIEYLWLNKQYWISNSAKFDDPRWSSLVLSTMTLQPAQIFTWRTCSGYPVIESEMCLQARFPRNMPPQLLGIGDSKPDGLGIIYFRVYVLLIGASFGRNFDPVLRLHLSLPCL